MATTEVTETTLWSTRWRDALAEWRRPKPAENPYKTAMLRLIGDLCSIADLNEVPAFSDLCMQRARCYRTAAQMARAAVNRADKESR